MISVPTVVTAGLVVHSGAVQHDAMQHFQPLDLAYEDQIMRAISSS